MHQKYITNGTVLTEPLLNICGRHWTPKRIRKIPLKPGRRKERSKDERSHKRDQQLWQGWVGGWGGKTLMVGKSAGTERGL